MKKLLKSLLDRGFTVTFTPLANCICRARIQSEEGVWWYSEGITPKEALIMADENRSEAEFV